MDHCPHMFRDLQPHPQKYILSNTKETSSSLFSMNVQNFRKITHLKVDFNGSGGGV
jgi:hypothetical protein